MISESMNSPGPHPSAEGIWRWASWGVVLFLLVLGLSLWESFPPGIWHDDGVYVMLGRSLAEGEGLRYLGVEGSPLAPKFPPLFPLLLAMVWLLFPTFPDNASILSGLNLLIIAGAGGLFAAYLKNALKLRPQIAVLITLLAWISPQMWRVSLLPLSEPLFLLGLVAALWAGARVEEERGGGLVWIFILAGAVAIYARTLGLAVLAAGSLALLVRRRPKAAAGIFLGLVALLLPWALWSRWAAGSIPDVLQDTLGPYGPWLVEQVTRYPGEFGCLRSGKYQAPPGPNPLPSPPGVGGEQDLVRAASRSLPRAGDGGDRKEELGPPPDPRPFSRDPPRLAVSTHPPSRALPSILGSRNDTRAQEGVCRPFRSTGVCWFSPLGTSGHRLPRGSLACLNGIGVGLSVEHRVAWPALPSEVRGVGDRGTGG